MIRLLILCASIAFAGCVRPTRSDGQFMSFTSHGIPDASTSQAIVTSGTSQATTSAMGPGYVKVACTNYSSITWGASPVATIRDQFVGPTAQLFYLDTAMKAAVIQNTSSATCVFATMVQQ